MKRMTRGTCYWTERYKLSWCCPHRPLTVCASQSQAHLACLNIIRLILIVCMVNILMAEPVKKLQPQDSNRSNKVLKISKINYQMSQIAHGIRCDDFNS